MNKAFLFDMDGVLVDSEPAWIELENEYLPKFFGTDIAEKLGSLIGLGAYDIMNRARSLGAVFEEAEYLQKVDDIAKQVYARSLITPNTNELVEYLMSHDYKVALVSQSPKSWIDQVLPRLPFSDTFTAVISLHGHAELKRKPEPDGFLEACSLLDAAPKDSIALEDSNFGIRSGKAAGCYTIGFRGNLVPGYEQVGADAYADTMDDVIKLVQNFEKN